MKACIRYSYTDRLWNVHLMDQHNPMIAFLTYDIDSVLNLLAHYHVDLVQIDHYVPTSSEMDDLRKIIQDEYSRSQYFDLQLHNLFMEALEIMKFMESCSIRMDVNPHIEKKW